jgi:hypothetical protein
MTIIQPPLRLGEEEGMCHGIKLGVLPAENSESDPWLKKHASTDATIKNLNATYHKTM